MSLRQSLNVLAGGSTGSTITIKDEGTSQGTATIFDFIGTGVTASVSGTTATINVPGGGGSQYTEVLAYANLPVVVGNPAVGTVYLVQTSTGTWVLFNKKEKGLWRRTANNGVLADWTYLGDAAELTVDTTFVIGDSGDNTKELQFDCSSITTGNIRTMVIPDASGTLALRSNKLSVFAATTSAELAGVISDETGSGALAFATSPTLVTPILGTPTSGTLSTCTGLPISTGVSGLGTGVATFLGTPSSANLAAALTDETGSGAAVFATSPTLVTPILGTPTSGTLSTCTGLPISTGVSGLGTGVATFLATPSSANLATAVTDETGSGALVFATSPSLVTPVLGTPTSGALTNCTADGTNAVGFRQIPQNSQSAAYTTLLADGGKHIYHPSADTTARIWTIDSNANVAYPVGTAITFINDSSAGVITIAIASDTMILAGAGTTGSRTLAANGIATAVKMTSVRWIINGTGLT